MPCIRPTSCRWTLDIESSREIAVLAVRRMRLAARERPGARLMERPPSPRLEDSRVCRGRYTGLSEQIRRPSAGGHTTAKFTPRQRWQAIRFDRGSEVTRSYEGVRRELRLGCGKAGPGSARRSFPRPLPLLEWLRDPDARTHPRSRRCCHAQAAWRPPGGACLVGSPGWRRCGGGHGLGIAGPRECLRGLCLSH